jgi:hypothetical protein
MVRRTGLATSVRRGGLALLCLAAFAVPAAGAQAAKDDLDLVSRASGATGAKGNGDSDDSPWMSSDGRFVAFGSQATNLSPDDGDTDSDVYVRDLQTGTTTLVSRAAGAGGANGNGHSFVRGISGRGRFVVFHTDATNLSPDDGDTGWDVYVRDLQTGTTTLVSRAAGAGGAKGNGRSLAAAISADGRFVVFESQAMNLSPDDADDTQDVYVRDLQTSTTTLVSRAGGGSGAKGDDHSSGTAISADGRFVAFYSSAVNLSPDDPDDSRDVYVRDLETNTTTLVSRAAGAAGAKGNDGSDYSSMSSDGRFVAFSSSSSNLSPDDPEDDGWDVYVRDLQTNTTTLTSRATGAGGIKGNNDADVPSISADGRFVAFESSASNLSPDDGDANYDVFVRDLQANTTALVSRAAGASGANGNNGSYSAVLSGNGRFVAFASAATNLHPDDGDTTADMFRRDMLGNAPAAAADAYATAHDTPLTVAAPGVLANDADADHDPLSALVVSGPAHGTLALAADGSFTYSPARGYSGPDSFTYRASDGGLDSSPATVAITVKPAPAPPPAAAVPAPQAPAVKRLCQGRPATIVRTAGRDVLLGTPQADVIVALGGNDVVRGLGGNDRICAGAGNDRVDGGAGSDRLIGGPGNDTLAGGAGNDRINARDGRRETVRCGGGKDRVSADRVDRAIGCERIARR